MLAVFGALWLVVEVTAFFAPDAAPKFRAFWPWFLGAGATISLVAAFPRLSRSCYLTGGDVRIEIRVGDLLQEAGDWVIGSNTQFACMMEPIGPINPRSLQGQFTHLFYNSQEHLVSDVTQALSSTPVKEHRNGCAEYEIGTVAKIKASSRTVYLVAIAELNDSNVARSSFQTLQRALPALWEHIATKGNLNTLVVPILGSGFSRIKEPREQIAREIINSFLAASTAWRFTDHLKIMVSYDDFAANRIDLDRLGRYVEHICAYSEFGTATKGSGVPVPTPDGSAGA